MQPELIRTYYPGGTNGALLLNGAVLCATIELPWINNEPRISCIPEGRYRLVKRYSPHFKWHLMLENVPQRSSILIHPANNAVKELKGCIAPVVMITGEGTGISSVKAMQKITGTLFPVMETQSIY